MNRKQQLLCSYLVPIQAVVLTFFIITCISRTASAKENTAYSSERISTLLNMNDHIRYMDVNKGCFRPDVPITRGEMAKMFYALLMDKPAVSDEIFSDVKGTDYYLEANAMGAIGVMRGIDGQFKVLNSVTRAEFASTLRRLFPKEPESATNRTFSDVPENYWGKAAIAFSTERGWLSGYPDGSFHPDQPITRAEAVAVMNKVLGRSADRNAAENGKNIRILLDVPQNHWAFYQILEATIRHEYTKDKQGNEHWVTWDIESSGLPSGLFFFKGELYYIYENGLIARSIDLNGRYFDQNGHYTTKDTELDRFLTQVISKVTDSGMTMWEKRRALFLHIRDSYAYLQRPPVAKNETGWENRYALRFFREGLGNCYSYAAAYGLLLRKIGYDVEFIVGEVSYSSTNLKFLAHGWVEIQTSEGIRIDDPESEMYHRDKNFCNFSYKTQPAIYRK